jgi:hypothetical protein
MGLELDVQSRLRKDHWWSNQIKTWRCHFLRQGRHKQGAIKNQESDAVGL